MRTLAAILLLFGLLAVFIVLDQTVLHWYAEDVDDLESRIEVLEADLREQQDNAGRVSEADEPASDADWREAEYEKLASIRAGTTMAILEEALGPPTFITEARDDSGLIEHSYQGRDYWVQAVYDDTGTALLLTITSCDLDFKPRFNNALGDIVLNESTFSDAARPQLVRYYASGATSNSNYYDQYSRGNPGFYKNYFLAINDACPAVANYVRGNAAPFLGFYEPRAYSEDDELVAAFRDNSVPNTYGESSIDGIGLVLESFQVGVNRLLVRTVPKAGP